MVFDLPNDKKCGQNSTFPLIGIQNGFHPKCGLAGSIEGAEVTASSRFLSSWSLIFTQPTLDVQPFREATKPFWEIWMEFRSNLSPFFFKEQVWKLKFCTNKHLCYVIYFSHSFWMTLYWAIQAFYFPMTFLPVQWGWLWEVLGQTLLIFGNSHSAEAEDAS